MDRKEEFARRVKAIEAAHAARDHAARRTHSAAVNEEIAALRRRLHDGDVQAISEALDLLEIRRPAFGVGYAQEKLARSLKKAPLQASHLARLEALAGQLVTAPLQGGQLREVTRVLAGRTSPQLAARMEALCAEGETAVVRRRAARVLAVVRRPRQ